MEHEERIRILLSMQEHPERYSDESPWKRNGENSVQVTLKNWTL